VTEPIRWGILGTAGIARRSFSPGLRAAGGGRAYVVAGRDLESARAYAERNEIEQARQGYESVIDDDDVDAVYVPLPNELHAEWTIAALRAGKAVLCEKPLCATLAQTLEVLREAEERAGLLWEAFVWPFRGQTRRLEEIVTTGEIGEPREVQCSWHFTVTEANNIRLSRELGGGALRDIGCYPISLARWLFQAASVGGIAQAAWNESGVDIEMAGVLSFSGERRLVFGLGFRGPEEQITRVLGPEGEIILTAAYHSSATSLLEVRRNDGTVIDRSTHDAGPSFSDAIRHIHRVLHGEEAPRHLAVDEAPGNAVAIDLLDRSARSGCFERA
jgi:predicted dehydrogenase